MATFPRVPLYDRSRPVPADGSLFSWSNANPQIYTNPIPKRDYDFPLPPPIPSLIDYSATGGNPSLYKAVALPSRRAPLFDRNPVTYTIPGNYSWPGTNATVFLAQLAPPPPTAPVIPPSSWSIPRLPYFATDWTPFNLALPATGQWEPFFTYDFPLPPPVPRLQDPSWYTVGNPGLYTNPIPINQYDWSLPQPRIYPSGMGSWSHENPNLYTNPIPHNQYDWPLLKETPQPDVRSYAYGSTIYAIPGPPPPVVPVGGDDQNKIRVGIVAGGRVSDGTGNPGVGGSF